MADLRNQTVVGRHTEIERASSAIERAFNGNGQTLSVVGEPGIGKTVLLDWIDSEVKGRNGLVLPGRCYEDQGSPAYWPWNEIIRSHLSNVDDATATELYGRGLGRLATVFPVLQRLDAGAQQLPEFEDPAEARFLLHDEFSAVVRSAAEHRPVAILLDDLQWGDEASLLLLEYLSKALANAPVLIVFAHWELRQANNAHLARMLGGLSRERSFHRLQLRRLGREDSDVLMSSFGLQAISESTARSVYELTAGNPFFLGEIAQLLASEEVGPAELGSLRAVPDSIRSMMIRRLDTLSPEAIALLETAAVIGQEFDVAILRASLSASLQVALARLLEEAESARFIERVEGHGHRWRFQHGLTQRALVSEIAAGSRESLHAAVLGGFEAVLGAAADDRASEMAEHALQAESLIGPERVAHYCRVAGQRAMEALLPEPARRLFEEAISRTNLSQCNDQTAWLLSGYAHSLFASGSREQFTTAVNYSRMAVEAYIGLGRPLDAARHLTRPIRSDYGLTGIAELFRTVIELIDPESREAGFLYAGLILWSYLDEFDFDASMAAYDKAMHVANATGDEYLRLLCLAYLGSVNRHYGNRGKDVEASSTAAELARKLGRRWVECQARLITSTDYMFKGQIRAATSDAERGMELARELNNVPRIVSAISAKMELAVVTCKFDLVRSLAAEAIDLDPDDDRVLRDVAYAEFISGNIDDAKRAVNSLVSLSFTGIDHTPDRRSKSISPMNAQLLAATVGAVVTGDVDMLAAARRSINTTLDEIESDTGESQPAIGLLCTRLDPDPELAATLLSTVEAPIDWKWMRASIGSVALLAGDETRARAEFQSCYEMFQNEFSPLPLAWTCIEYSDALIKLDSPADHKLIGELHDLGIKIATDYGMPPLQKMLESSRAAFARHQRGSVERPAGLSDREIEVLRFVAGGLSNTEIAERLIISPHTVNRHVTNLFSKLGVSSRAAATDQAHRLGLI